MSRLRKKPVVIDAVQYNGFESVDDTRTPMFDLSFDAPDWLVEAQAKADDEPGAVYLEGMERLKIVTLEGGIFAQPGDWIIRGVQGEIYPCKPDIFVATYEAAEAAMGPSEQAAFDGGAGHRCITHDRTNPYSAATMPAQHAAWERGWQKTDHEMKNAAA